MLAVARRFASAATPRQLGIVVLRREDYMKLLTALVLLLVSTGAAAQVELYGVWGSEAQCARQLIIPKGTKRAAPFEIHRDWLGHGEVWCRLIWSSVVPSAQGLVAVATGLCGEDAVRDYQLRFNLSGEALTVIWNWQHANGPLQRCQSRH